MEVKVTIGFNEATMSLLESFISIFSGSVGKPSAPSAAIVAGPSEITKAESKSSASTGKAEEKEVTIEVVRAAVQSKAQSGKKEDVKKILGEFNVTKVTDLQKADYPQFLEKVNALK